MQKEGKHEKKHHTHSPGQPQWAFFLSRAKYTCYGGARGGGKSWAVVHKAAGGAFQYPGIQILLVRREFDEMENTLTSAKRLYDAGVYVNPVLPPAAAPGECLLRVSCMATHTEALLDEAMDIIAEVLGKDEHV